MSSSIGRIILDLLITQFYQELKNQDMKFGLFILLSYEFLVW